MQIDEMRPSTTTNRSHTTGKITPQLRLSNTWNDDLHSDNDGENGDADPSDGDGIAQP